MYRSDFSYKAENSKSGVKISVNSDNSKELMTSVLDVLIKSCLNNDEFKSKLTDNKIS